MSKNKKAKAQGPSEEIHVYAFIAPDGGEEEFLTLDEDVALIRAATYGLTIVVRTYEYTTSRVVPKTIVYEGLDEFAHSESER